MKQINITCWWYNYKDKKTFDKFLNIYFIYTSLKVTIANKENLTLQTLILFSFIALALNFAYICYRITL